jgi:probable phosphoglycerate mutase
MDRLIFIRHGESEANITATISNRDLPHALTELGRLQATEVAQALAPLGVQRVYSSPILRARETAQIVAGVCDMEVTLADALREFDCGVMEGRADEEAWAANRQAVLAWESGDYDYRIPGGESFQDMRSRFVPFVSHLLTERGQGCILLVSHGAVLHMMLPEVLSNVEYAFSRWHPLRNCARVVARRHKDGLICEEWDGHVAESTTGRRVFSHT